MLPDGTPLAGTPYLKHTELFVPQQFPMVPEITVIECTFPDSVFFADMQDCTFTNVFQGLLMVSGEP